jgi:hypothetical protein
MSAGGVKLLLNCDKKARVGGGISAGGFARRTGWSSHMLKKGQDADDQWEVGDGFEWKFCDGGRLINDYETVRFE